MNIFKQKIHWQEFCNSHDEIFQRGFILTQVKTYSKHFSIPYHGTQIWAVNPWEVQILDPQS